MNRKSLLKITLLLLLPLFIKAQSQQNESDSLHIALKKAAHDTVKIFALADIASYYAESDRDSSMKYIEAAIDVAGKMNQKLWVAALQLLKAYIIQKEANFSLSLKLCNESLAIIQDEKNEKNVYIPRDNEFAYDPKKFRRSFALDVFHQLGNTYSGAGNKQKAIEYYKKEILLSQELNTKSGLTTSNMNIGSIYLEMGKLDSAFIYSKLALENVSLSGWKAYEGFILEDIGEIYFKKGQTDSALKYYNKSLMVNKAQSNVAGEAATNVSIARLYQNAGQADSMKYYAGLAFKLATKLKSPTGISTSANLISDAWKMQGNADSALAYLALSKNLADSLHKDLTGKLTQFQNTNFEEQMQLEKTAQASVAAKNKIRTIALFAGLGVLSLLAIIFYRNTKQKHKANLILEKTLTDLKSTQTQLIQTEKMASLGELTAGIAHEIQNPLNFVNNFSEVSRELIEELKSQKSKLKSEEQDEILNDIDTNLEKINHHGKRADAIVKGMLQHSRSSSGQKEPTDINALCDEYLRLAYHGLRAKDKTFNATLQTDFDETIGNISIIPQDIGRVILNLINNAFYVIDEKKKQIGDGYEPTVAVNTKKNNGKIVISVKDNGNGIPQKVLDKIFQPFFTTKPTGQGTGLGLSLAYDIVKVHGGELKVETREGEGAEFIISLPVN